MIFLSYKNLCARMRMCVYVFVHVRMHAYVRVGVRTIVFVTSRVENIQLQPFSFYDCRKSRYAKRAGMAVKLLPVNETNRFYLVRGCRRMANKHDSYPVLD